MIQDFEEDLSESLPEDEELQAEYRFILHDRAPIDSLDELAGMKGTTDVSVGWANYELEHGEGRLNYEPPLPGEGDARITATFDVEEEIESQIRESVSRHFGGFLGMNLPGRHPGYYLKNVFRD